jgi:DNA repair protein RecO (recombination protein O)
MTTLRTYSTQALVLNKADFGEADSLVTCYAPHLGKFKAKAKGARRPQSHLGGHVEPITYIKMSLAQGRNLDIVTQSQTVKSFAPLHNDLLFLSSALYLADLVDQFTPEGEPNYAIFKLLSDTWQQLASIAEQTTSHQTTVPYISISDSSFRGDKLALWMLIRRFEILLLKYLGYQPQLEHCLDCGTQILNSPNISRVFFSPQSGGVICSRCHYSQPTRPISIAALRLWHWLGTNTVATVIRVSNSKSQRLLKITSELGQIIQHYLIYLLGYQLSSAEWLERVQEIDYQKEPPDND